MSGGYGTRSTVHHHLCHRHPPPAVASRHPSLRGGWWVAGSVRIFFVNVTLPVILRAHKVWKITIHVRVVRRVPADGTLSFDFEASTIITDRPSKRFSHVVVIHSFNVFSYYYFSDFLS
jgi:hypothetical protein